MTDKDAANLRIPWPGLSVGLGVIALAALGTLAVIVGVKDVDILSTVALALAILAFAAQLIVTLAQGQQTAQLNADTKSALAEMRATTSSLLTNQRDQFDVVLKAALRTAIPAAVDDVQSEQATELSDPDNTDADASALAESLEDRIVARLNEALTQAQQGAQGALRRATVRDPDEELLELLKTYPEEGEGAPALAALTAAGPKAVAGFSRFAEKLRTTARTRKDRSVTYTRNEHGPGPTFRRLVQHGLVEEIEAPPPGVRGRVTYRITPLGIQAARLVLGGPGSPDWLKGTDWEG